jgi:hypothetical protein
MVDPKINLVLSASMVGKKQNSLRASVISRQKKESVLHSVLKQSLLAKNDDQSDMLSKRTQNKAVSGKEGDQNLLSICERESK